jgi:hypothetical protein
VRKSPQVTEMLPLLYRHRLSTGDFGSALEQFLGSGAGLVGGRRCGAYRRPRMRLSVNRRGSTSRRGCRSSGAVADHPALPPQ